MRYRIGNRFLSEKEYQEEAVANWAGILFLVGGIGMGVVLHNAMPDSWPKFIRFIVIVSGGGIIGFASAYFAKYIRELCFVVFGLGLLWGAGALIWTLI